MGAGGWAGLAEVPDAGEEGDLCCWAAATFLGSWEPLV